MNKYLVVAGLLLTLAACKAATMNDKDVGIAAKPIPEKSASLTETTTPNKPATADAASVETEDLASLKEQLNALNSDISRLRGGLTQAEPQMAATKVIPDTQLSTPRSLVSDGVVDIPDSKQELAEASRANIDGMRVGIHEDKTRLVFDVDGRSVQKPDVNLKDNILKIKIFKAKWALPASQSASLDSTLGVSKVSEEKDDTVVTITLASPMHLNAPMVLPPATPGGPHRLVIDLVPAH